MFPLLKTEPSPTHTVSQHLIECTFFQCLFIFLTMSNNKKKVSNGAILSISVIGSSSLWSQQEVRSPFTRAGFSSSWTPHIQDCHWPVLRVAYKLPWICESIDLTLCSLAAKERRKKAVSTGFLPKSWLYFPPPRFCCLSACCSWLAPLRKLPCHTSLESGKTWWVCSGGWRVHENIFCGFSLHVCMEKSSEM